MSEIYEEATAFMVTILPEGHPERSSWVLMVERTAPGRYALRRGGYVYNFHANEWAYGEPQPSSRTDEFKDSHRSSLESALAKARELAPGVRVNGKTALDMLERYESGWYTR